MSEIQESPVPVFDIVALLKQHVEPINLKITERVNEYLAAKEEAGNALENKQRFEKASATSRAAAEAINLDIRDRLRQRDVGTKEAHKKRAERAGHLEDVEIYESMAREAEVSIASAELRASRQANEIMALRSQARSAANGLLSELVASKVNDEFMAIAIFVNLVAEIAGRGDSVYYNARQDVFNPMEFAVGELAKILRVAFSERNQNLSSDTFLAEIPDDLGQSLLSPITVKKMEAKITALEGAL